MKINLVSLVVSVLVLLIVFNISLPEEVFQTVNQKEIKMGVIIVALIVAYHTPVMGVLGLISFFVLLHNSQTLERKKSFGGGKTEKYKKKHMEVMNESFPVSLEEEVIRGMDSDKYKCSMPQASYQPVLEKTCNQSLKI